MEMVTILRIVFVLSGILFLILDFYTYARQKMTESIGLSWNLFSLALLITGIAPGLLSFLLEHIVILVLIAGLIFAALLFKISIAVSGLIMKNQELAMQVSLLNQENERILHEVGILNDEKKDTVCN